MDQQRLLDKTLALYEHKRQGTISWNEENQHTSKQTLGRYLMPLILQTKGIIRN